jgi:CelD/BcsL family acetyltransferase involved in cellulose biosynthesis
MHDQIPLRLEILEADDPFAVRDHLPDESAWADVSFFHTPRWCTAWAQHFAANGRHACVIAYEGPTVVGVLPLTVTSMRLTRLRWPRMPVVVTTGGVLGSADHLGIVARDDQASAALVDTAGEFAGLRPLILAAVQSGVHSQGQGGSVRECPSAEIPTGATWDDVRATWSKNRRKKIKQRADRFADLGGSFTWLDAPSDVAEALPVVVSLHNQRWSAEERTTQFGSSTGRHEFLRDLILGNGEGTVWVQLALLGDGPVGALIGFDHGGVVSVYQSGWDPDRDEVGIGLLQYATAYEHAVVSGAGTFDMLRGADDYKLRFATQTTMEVDLVKGSMPATNVLRRVLT